MKLNKKRVIVGLSAAILSAGMCISGICATQIYTPDQTVDNVTAKGSLYGYKLEDYIRIAFSTTYASGPVDYMVDTATTLYAKGSYSSNEIGIARDGVSAQSGQQVFTKMDAVTAISSSHSAIVYAAEEGIIPLDDLSLNISQIE